MHKCQEHWETVNMILVIIMIRTSFNYFLMKLFQKWDAWNNTWISKCTLIQFFYGYVTSKDNRRKKREITESPFSQNIFIKRFFLKLLLYTFLRRDARNMPQQVQVHCYNLFWNHCFNVAKAQDDKTCIIYQQPCI